MVVGCVDEDNLTSEIIYVGKNNTKIGTTDITSMYEKYLVVGMTKEQSIDVVSKYDFTLLNQNISRPTFIERYPEFENKEVLIFKRELKQSFSSDHATLIHLGFEGDKLVAFKGFYSITWKLP